MPEEVYPVIDGANPPTPPEGYAIWLDFAAETMDTRTEEQERLFAGMQVSRQAMRDAVKAELVALKLKAGEIPSFNNDLPRYASDPAAWAIAQAEALRNRDIEKLDWDNLADEILEIAKAEKRELGRSVSALMASLAKRNLCGTSPIDERLVLEQSRLVLLQLADSPSLQRCLKDKNWLLSCWSDAIIGLAAAGLPVEKMPEESPWDLADLLDISQVE